MNLAIEKALRAGAALARTVDVASANAVGTTFSDDRTYQEATSPIEFYAFASAYWSTISGLLSAMKGRAVWCTEEETKKATEEGKQRGYEVNTADAKFAAMGVLREKANQQHAQDQLWLYRAVGYLTAVAARLGEERDAIARKHEKPFTGSLTDAHTDGMIRALSIDLTSANSIKKTVLELRPKVPYTGNSHEEAMFLSSLWGGIAGRLMVKLEEGTKHADANQK